jgi:hypothetical protein
MNIDKLLRLIDNVFIEAENYVLTHRTGKTSIDDTKRVLHLLKEQVMNNPVYINQRILRAMHDIGMASYKDFENTSLEDAIEEVISLLYNEVPIYKTLEPLREDFGNDYPI